MSTDPRIIAVGEEPPPLEPAPPPGRADAERKPKRKAGTGGGRFGVLNAFIDFTLRDLQRNQLAVWLVLYRDTKRDGLARTGQGDIARRINASKSTVIRAIRKLCRLGLLTVVYRGTLRRGPSAYRAHPLAEPSRCQAVDTSQGVKMGRLPVSSC